MKIVLMCGSHPRHLYVAKTLYDQGFLGGLVVETREVFVQQPPAGLEEIDRENFIRHFKARDEAEEKFFGAVKDWDYKSEVKTYQVDWNTLNAPETLAFVKSIEPEYVISYGVHKINDELIDAFSKRCFNIHGGLSPWYRGNITLFWPFYFLEPNWAGMTVHSLSNRMDAGDILHHSVPVLEYGDKIHDVACKAVKQVAEDLCVILQKIQEGTTIVRVPQRSTGKLFIAKNWKPQHLRLIYNTFDDDIVDKYLNGELMSLEPELIKAF